MLANEEKLLCLCNLARKNADTIQEIRALIEATIDWEKLHHLAELNTVIPLTYQSLCAAGLEDRIPSDIRKKWHSVSELIRDRNLKRVEWANKMLTAMSTEGIEMIVLKGSLFADVLYSNRAYKKMNDVDVLIRREDAERAMQVLEKVGFTGVGALFGKDDLSAKSHHTPPYVSSDLACATGLHWGLTSPYAPWSPDTAEIWRRHEAVQVADAPAFRMCWEDNLLHLCVHLPFYKIGLREIADVYNVVLFADRKIDWQDFDNGVSDWRAADAVYRVLSLANALFDLGIPAELMAKWKSQSSPFTIADTEARLAEPNLILASRSTHIAKIEKAFAVFKLSEKYSERLKAYAGMWSMLFWPKPEELRKISAQKSLGDLKSVAKARVLAPGKIWRAMERDHGKVALAAMTAINAGDIAKATLTRPFKGEGKSLKEHPAWKLLEVLE